MKIIVSIIAIGVLSGCLGFAEVANSSDQKRKAIPPSELTIYSHLGAGFFAELNKVIDNILHYESQNLQKIYVDWSQEFFPYKDDPFANGWDLYFEPIQATFSPLVEIPSSRKHGSAMHYHELHDQGCIAHWIEYEKALPYRLKANRVIEQYIEIKTHILDKLDTIVKENMEGFYCVGAHIRYGSDHVQEAPAGTPKLQDYIDEIKAVLEEKGLDKVKVYLATDSHYVVDLFKEEFSDILLYITAFRAQYRDEPHLIYGRADYWQEHKEEWHSKKPGYYGGETVLLDCLLLSKCDIFLHSSSNVSDFVSYFNPYIRSIYLPRAAKTWPCRHGK